MRDAAMVLLVLVGSFVGPKSAKAANPVSNADDLVAQHLDSIASPDVRAKLKTRVAQGPVEYKILIGGAGTAQGRVQMASDGKKIIFMMKLSNNVYLGEQFIFNGDKVGVAFSTAQHQRSAFGSFLLAQDAIVREGLLGGTLSTAWPLLDLKDRKAKLSFEGLKKIDGQELYALRYRPKKSSDLEISLYFDPQTYHHVETVYYLESSTSFADFGPSGAVGLAPGSGGQQGGANSATGGTQGSGTAETARARQFPNRYRLTEKFSDFKAVDGVTLPTHEDIQFSQELQNGRTILWDFNLTGLEIGNNVPVDPRNFEVK